MSGPFVMELFNTFDYGGGYTNLQVIKRYITKYTHKMSTSKTKET